MTGKDLLNAMNYVEEELVENCIKQETNQVKSNTKISSLKNRKTTFKKAALKWSAVAAAVLIFLGGGVAYAAKYGILRTNPGWKSGYHVAITSRRVTEDEFSKEVLAVKQELLEDIAASENKNDKAFGWIQDFNTVEESIDFIGHSSLKTPTVPGRLEQTGAVVLGNDQAELLYVEFFARSAIKDDLFGISISESARIYTTDFSWETGAGIKDDGLTYNDEIYITANGKEAVIMFPTEYRGNSGIHGYLVEDCVVYELWINNYEQDHDRAMQILKEWLDQF